MRFLTMVKSKEPFGQPPQALMDAIAQLGPFTEAKEVVGGYAIFELPSKKEAIEETVKFMQLHKDHWPGWEGETEVRPMFVVPDFAPTKKC
jgi:hypothetical protein